MEVLPVLPPADPVPVHHPGAAVPHLLAHKETKGVIPLSIPVTAPPVPVRAGDLLLLLNRHHVPGNILHLVGVLLILVLRESRLVVGIGSLVRLLVVRILMLVGFLLKLVVPLYLLRLWAAR